jgi:hypothetical protein
MPMFCVGCGSPLHGQSEFCGKCGLRAGQSPPPSPAVSAPALPAAAKSGGGTILKVVLIGIGVLFVFGAIAVGGMYYTARRYVKFAEDATGISAGDVAKTIRDAAHHPSEGSPRRKRDGCALLSKDEASAILGIEVERIDGTPNDHESGEHCFYFVKPGSIEENAEKVKRAVAEIPNDPKGDPNQLPPESIDMIKAANRGLMEGVSNGEAPYFAFTVERENGKLACAAFKIANRLGGGDIATGGSPQQLDVGDQAIMGMADSRLCVVQGQSAVTLDLSQVTGARPKGIVLAKAILPRL